MRLRVRNGISAAASSVVHHRALYHAIDVIAIQRSLIESLEKQGADTLARDIAVSPLAKTAADTIPRQRTTSLVDIELCLVKVQIDPTDQSCRTITGIDGITCEIKGREARRTCRVDGQTRARKVKAIGNSIGNAPEKRVGNHFVARVFRFHPEHLVHRPNCADKYAYARCGVALGHEFRIIPGVLDTLPGNLKKESFLRIQHIRFAGRDIEKQRIEPIYILYETTTVSCLVAMPQTLFVTVCRNFVDAVPTSSQVVP